MVVVREEPEGLRIEDAVGFFVHAVGDEKEDEAWEDQAVVVGVCLNRVLDASWR